MQLICSPYSRPDGIPQVNYKSRHTQNLVALYTTTDATLLSPEIVGGFTTLHPGIGVASPASNISSVFDPVTGGRVYSLNAIGAHSAEFSVNTNGSLLTSPSTALTVMCRFYIITPVSTAYNSGLNPIMYTNTVWYIANNDATGLVFFGQISNNDFTQAVTVSTNVWTTMVFRFSGGVAINLSLWDDFGNKIASPASIVPSNTFLPWGSQGGQMAALCSGFIGYTDYTAIWSRYLLDIDVRSIVTTPNSLFGVVGPPLPSRFAPAATLFQTLYSTWM